MTARLLSSLPVPPRNIVSSFKVIGWTVFKEPLFDFAIAYLTTGCIISYSLIFVNIVIIAPKITEVKMHHFCKTAFYNAYT